MDDLFRDHLKYNTLTMPVSDDGIVLWHIIVIMMGCVWLAYLMMKKI